MTFLRNNEIRKVKLLASTATFGKVNSPKRSLINTRQNRNDFSQ